MGGVVSDPTALAMRCTSPPAYARLADHPTGNFDISDPTNGTQAHLSRDERRHPDPAFRLGRSQNRRECYWTAVGWPHGAKGREKARYNLNIHLHNLGLDGVYRATEDALVFHEVRAPAAEHYPAVL